MNRDHLVIDCHGHFTTAPVAHDAFRQRQLEAMSRGGPAPPAAVISDDELREALEQNQLRVMAERGGDVVLLSPKASGMQHHVADRAVAVTWARACNDLIHRAAALYPNRLVPVCQLPQTPDGDVGASVHELRRCVEQLGFVACNLNPDPSGGHWTGLPLTDESWFPLYEAMVELDVPAMIHVSGSCNPNFHTLGAHYLNADTAVFMQLLERDLFDRYPTLRFVIPHGGGAVPYHWGRYRGLAARLGRPDPAEVLTNVFFDTCVYHQPGMQLLIDVVGADNLLFASEMLGAVRGRNPQTDAGWDDTKRYLDDIAIAPKDRELVFEGNARLVYPRLNTWLNG